MVCFISIKASYESARVHIRFRKAGYLPAAVRARGLLAAAFVFPMQAKCIKKNEKTCGFKISVRLKGAPHQEGCFLISLAIRASCMGQVLCRYTLSPRFEGRILGSEFFEPDSPK